MAPGPRTAMPDLDAPQGAGTSAASADAGLGIFAHNTRAAAAPEPAMTAPPIDPTLGGRRRPVGVASGSATTESAVVPIRAVLGAGTRQHGLALLRLRRQMGVAALTVVTLVAGLGSAWTVRAVFANVPHTRAPAVWRMETQGTPADKAAVAPRSPAASSPSHSAKTTRLVTAPQAGSSADHSGRGSVSSSSSSSSSGHQSRNGSGTGRKTSGRTASPSPTEVHHRKGRGTGTGAGGAAGADDPATHDTTPTIGVDNHGGGGGGGGGAGNGGGGGGGGTGLESAPPAATPSALPTPDSTGDSSGSGSGGSTGSSGGGGGGGGGHDDFVAGG